MLRQPHGEIRFKLGVGLWWTRYRIEFGDHERIHDLGTSRFEFRDRLRKVRDNARVSHLWRKHLAEHTKAGPCEAVFFEKRQVAGWYVAGTAGRRGIIRIRADDDIQQDGHIGDTAGHGAGSIA